MLYFLLSFIFSINCASSQIGYATYYGKKGGRTASGILLNPKALTAAHKTLPFGSLVKVTTLKGKHKSVIVKIIDRGPYGKGRIIDLTPAAFKRLAPLKYGVIKVKLTIIKLGKKKRKHSNRRHKSKRHKQKKHRKINAFGQSTPF